ncbi:endonuclease [Acholeplasma hippikon]|uniref:Extracellular ribonuclease n=1 Tax=Acholeplasma hippikon TaxID=264636 RepID=A0A449BKR4_9MOLU|nr:endonuclease [Acholeplasma hippikon]VEU83065.1 Extracellular ribonuclease precursor [Acholeplasma hippikon]
MKKILLIVLLSFSIILTSCQKTKEVTDYPQNQKETYEIAFYDGDTLLEKSSYALGDSITIIPNTNKEGFDFIGWYVNKDFTGNPSQLEFIYVSQDLNFYGKWVSNGIPDINYDFTGYYTSLKDLSGTALKDAVTKLVKSAGKATGSTAQVKEADAWQGSHYLIYTGLGAYGNREHVWPNSKLGNAPEYDLHNLRAANVGVNSTRANYPYGTGSGQWKLSSGKFYPGDEHIGDVARIVLYISLRYNLNIDVVGNLDMFLRWHEQDPVNEFELTRNNRIQGIQQNRNPFIDFPELVYVVYGKAQVSSSYVTITNYILRPQTYSFNTIFIQ